ncbi:MAG: antibiotic biosynthesis monooxygenase [Myxococcota bacterium]|jgi:autoinducer 2-degrading protein
MLVTCVYIEVKEENVKEFIAATIKNQECSAKEPGCRRFDFLQSDEDQCRFMLYEAYDSEEAAKAHKETAHYMEWRAAVAPHMAVARRGVTYSAIRP